jgi:hypothetical protein
MTIHPHTVRRSAAVALAAGVGVAVTLSAGVSGATDSHRTEVIHLFSRAESFSYTKAGGAIVKRPPQTPHAGDHIDATDDDFVGTATDHAKKWTDSDNEICFFTSSHGGTCYGQIAIGGSMILARGGLSPSPNDKLVVYGGSGVFEGATGIANAVDLHPHSPTSPSEVTITLHLPRR